jgi:excisionase family DNA binding protein
MSIPKTNAWKPVQRGNKPASRQAAKIVMPPEIKNEIPSLDFPGRTTLYVHEVAAKLSISERHVADLIDEGRLRAVNIAGKNITDRKFYRIPIESYREFIQASLV